MTAKEYLGKIHQYRKALEDIERRIEELDHEATGMKAIVYDQDRVQVSPDNHMEEVMVKLLSEGEKWAKLRARYERESRKREEQIAGMERNDHAEILRLRYVKTDKHGRMLTLEEIACIMHLSFYRTAHLHGEALEAFRRKYLAEKR